MFGRSPTKYLLVALVTLLAIAGCGGGHRKLAAVNCRYVPPRSPHALAALEGLACPSALPKAVRGSVRSTGLQEMDDSTDLSALLGTDYPAYAGYTDGSFKSYGDIYTHFHPLGKQTVGIDVLGGSARATDLEPSPGNFQNDPNSAGPWARGQIDNAQNNGGNTRPVIYTMGSWQGAIEQSLANSGVPRCATPTQQGCYLEWIAVWDNNPVLYAHMTIHQFIDHGPNGENRDRSVYDPSMLFPSASPPDPNFNPNFNLGYAAGVAGAYKLGFGKDHTVTTFEAAAWNVGWTAGHSHAKAQGQAARHTVPAPVDFNSSFDWGFKEGWARGVGGTFSTWFGVLYAHPQNPTAAHSGFVVAFPKAFKATYNAGWEADR